MKVVLAPDSFKECMSAKEAARAMEAGVRQLFPEAECVLVPMSDGGEGFAAALTQARGAKRIDIDCPNALGEQAQASYGLDGTHAYMDLASACGLEGVPEERRDIWKSHTRGLGVMIADALARGATHIVLGIGGSASNDCGLGMIVELGGRCLDRNGNELEPIPENFARIVAIEPPALPADVQIDVACDVTNPLCGPAGATHVFGSQKGATPEDVERLDALLAHIAKLSGHEPLAKEEGSGAAGGTGFALRAWLGARMLPGVSLLAQQLGVPEKVQGATWVFTGEGSVDGQSIAGKTPSGIARLAREAGVPCVVFAGVARPGAEALRECGVSEIVTITPPGQEKAESLRRGKENMEAAVAHFLHDHSRWA